MDVDIWLAPLSQSRAVLAGCIAVLCPSEVERASRYATAELRSRFAFSRGALRHILSCYTDEPPSALKFDSGPYGKPLLRHSACCFNVSHSGLLMACAVSQKPVGVDIEPMREIPLMLAIASKHFAVGEYKRLVTLPAVYRTRGFFECWTRKEALIKATGLGLSQGLDRFEVTFGPGVLPKLVQINDLSDDCEHWELHSFDLAEDHCGAIAVRARNIRLRFAQLGTDKIAGPAVELQNLHGPKSELLANAGVEGQKTTAYSSADSLLPKVIEPGR